MITRENKKFGYFPGCSVTGMNKAYDVSTRSAAEALGVELQELDDWNCCGATPYIAIHEKRSFVLCARNLSIAKELGTDLVTVCNCCYLLLRKTNKYMAENPKLRKEIQKALAAGGMSYDGEVKVRHFLDVVINDVGAEAVRNRTSSPLTGLNVAPYYGCQIGRPFGEIDDPEDPQMMDKLIGWLGGRTVPFPLKAKCCGGMMMATQPKLGQSLTGKILNCAVEAGADCIITACPLCQVNLEAYQDTISRKSGRQCRIPVLCFTQLMGTAFSLNAEQIALKDSMTPVGAMFAQKGI